MTVEAEGLDRPNSALTTSTLPHLRWRFESLVDQRVLLRGTIELDWLTLRIDAEVRRPVAEDVLRVEVDLRGRGRWRVALAPVLAIAQRRAGRPMQQLVDDWAAAVSGVADDPMGSATPLGTGSARRHDAAVGDGARQRAAAEAGFAAIRAELHAVEDRVAAMPWWRRSRRAWNRAHDAVVMATERRLGDTDSASPFSLPLARGSVAATIRNAPRRRRRQLIDPTVDRALAGHVALLERRSVDVAVHADGGRRAARADGELDRLLDTRWLATPISAIRYVLNLSSDAEATSVLGGLASGDQW